MPFLPARSMAPPMARPIASSLTRATLLIAALALGACSNADRFGGSAGRPARGPVRGNRRPDLAAYFRDTIGDRVLFAVDQPTLNTVSRNTLAAQALADREPRVRRGDRGPCADEQGTREYNLALRRGARTRCRNS